MTIQEILSRCDHTLLKQTAVWADIKAVLDDGMKYRTASACIPPVYVRRAAEYAAGRLPICTVIGFPNGYNTAAVKVFEAQDAIANGADEIDMVMDLAALKAGNDAFVLAEIKRVKEACGDHILKVIIETCLLSRDEKLRACSIVSASGADYIKTSTGFAVGGATREDVKLLRANCAEHVKVKASGGIADLKDAEDFILLGADRLGTSRIVKAVKDMEDKWQRNANV